MNLYLLRFARTTRTTIGALYVDGVFECYVCEDRYRPPPEPKVPGETCIPIGRYEVRITHSPRFGVEMPLLLNVPGFEGIRIHPGNGAGDTEGCLLPGRTALPDGVGESRVAYHQLFGKLKAAKKPIFIDIALA